MIYFYWGMICIQCHTHFLGMDIYVWVHIFVQLCHPCPNQDVSVTHKHPLCTFLVNPHPLWPSSSSHHYSDSLLLPEYAFSGTSYQRIFKCTHSFLFSFCFAGGGIVWLRLLSMFILKLIHAAAPSLIYSFIAKQ